MTMRQSIISTRVVFRRRHADAVLLVPSGYVFALDELRLSSSPMSELRSVEAVDICVDHQTMLAKDATEDSIPAAALLFAPMPGSVVRREIKVSLRTTNKEAPFGRLQLVRRRGRFRLCRAQLVVIVAAFVRVARDAMQVHAAGRAIGR